MNHAQIKRLQEIRREIELNRDNEHLPKLARLNDILFGLVEMLLMEREGMEHGLPSDVDARIRSEQTDHLK